MSDDTAVALQVAVAPGSGDLRSEALTLTLDGEPIEPVAELQGAGGARIHVVESGAGTLRLTYEATVGPPPPAPAPGPEGGTLTIDAEALTALHQSAYCRSDLLAGFAAAELGAHRGEPDLPQRVADWVFERLAYAPGSSGPLDSSVETLLTNTGVCRDFAHLTITLLRALGVPARLAAVYAPGLTPMDFHAVVEARTTTGWEVVDATRLAPRSSLVRITTGRDAADTAFATTLRGNAELVAQSVFAIVDGDLPADDHVEKQYLA
ncbi:transglutaminase family protein [Aquihabitans sp. G128]|nr:transglutaminase family protein [Aquihabitans sp. G128]